MSDSRSLISRCRRRYTDAYRDAARGRESVALRPATFPRIRVLSAFYMAKYPPEKCHPPRARILDGMAHGIHFFTRTDTPFKNPTQALHFRTHPRWPLIIRRALSLFSRRASCRTSTPSTRRSAVQRLKRAIPRTIKSNHSIRIVIFIIGTIAVEGWKPRTSVLLRFPRFFAWTPSFIRESKTDLACELREPVSTSRQIRSN